MEKEGEVGSMQASNNKSHKNNIVIILSLF